MPFDPTTAKPIRSKFDPKTAVPVTPPLKEDPPDVPLPSDWIKPPKVAPADPNGRSVVSAFRRGFAGPREGDPFGINPENRNKVAFGMYDRPLDLVRGGLELAESLYGGVKQATGQALYNQGLTQSSPEVAADRAWELPEVVAQTLPPGMLSLGGLRAASAAKMIPGVQPAVNAARNITRAPISPEMLRRQQLMALAERHGVDMLPADVGGGMVRGATAASRQTLMGEPMIGNVATRANDQMQDAVRGAAQTQGDILAPVDAGEALQQGARTYSARTSAAGSKLYKRAEKAAGDTRFTPDQAVNKLDEEILRLMESRKPDDPEVKALQGFRDRLTLYPEGLSFEGLRQIISDAKSAGYTPDLRSVNVNRIMKGVASAAEDDMRSGLRMSGNSRAARLLDLANRHWQERVSTIDDVLEPVLGDGKSGEQSLAGIEQLARGQRGGTRHLGRLLNAMPAQAAQDTRATIIDRLGRAAPGAQDAEGDVFSTGTFLTNWNKMSPQGRAALFGHDPVLRRTLDELAQIAEAKKATASYTNTSNTGRAVNIAESMRTAARVATSGALVGAAGVLGLKEALMMLATEYGSARLLSSPRFARFLAGLPRQSHPTPAALASTQRGLATLAAREPGLAEPVSKIAAALSNPPPPPPSYVENARRDAALGATAGPGADLSKYSDAELQGLLGALVGASEPSVPASEPSQAPPPPPEEPVADEP